MRPYGQKRFLDFEYHDVADIHEMGAKSSVGRLPGKGGDIRSSFKRSHVKAATRRISKRLARIEGKNLCNEID